MLQTVLLSIVLSQAPQDAVLGTAFKEVAGDLRAAARVLPAESYGYRPAPAVRSFGQIVAHLAGANYLYCSQAKGTRLDPAIGARLGELRPFSDVATEAKGRQYTKDELIAVLDASVEFCETVYATAEQGTIAPTALRALVGNIAHSNEHYGNLVTYLRLNNIVPPSTERRRK